LDLGIYLRAMLGIKQRLADGRDAPLIGTPSGV
jgi:hypothetical protein